MDWGQKKNLLGMQKNLLGMEKKPGTWCTDGTKVFILSPKGFFSVPKKLGTEKKPFGDGNSTPSKNLQH